MTNTKEQLFKIIYPDATGEKTINDLILQGWIIIKFETVENINGNYKTTKLCLLFEKEKIIEKNI